MAVVQMKKLTLLGLNREKEQILRDIAFTGSVELSDQSVKLSDESWSRLAEADTPGAETSELEAELADLGKAIEALSPFEGKKKFLAGRAGKSRGEFDRALAEKEAVLSVARAVCRNLKEQAETEGRINLLNIREVSLSPWSPVDLPLSFRSTGSVGIVYGILPSAEKPEEIEAEMSQNASEFCLNIINSDKQHLYIQLLFHRTAKDAVLDVLKHHSFTEAFFESDDGLTPAALSAKYRAETKTLENRVLKLPEKLQEYASQLPKLRLLYDALAGALETRAARSRLLVTGETFLVEGFVPAALCGKLENILSKYTVSLTYEDPSEEDDTPTLLKNSAVVEPYEMVTSMYSLPQYGGLDPNTVVAPFFCIFFGMMLSDAGYGLILFLIGLYAQKKMKLEGTIKRMMGLMVQGGLSAVVAGVVYGSYFGDAISVVSNTFFHSNFVIKPLFDPMANPMVMLYACVALGFIQIVVGMGVNAYNMIREGHLLDAIFDIGFWYVVFAGILTLIFAGSVGLYISAAGALGLVLTQGRDKKNILSKFTSGLLSLYGITGYMSDLLSYSRLMALGLSTGVIASVFNKLGALAGRTIAGGILFIAVFLIGQVFNLAMGALGAFVHSSRLTYVEYFGKFYSGGGREFTPLKFKNRYVSLSVEEESTKNQLK